MSNHANWMDPLVEQLHACLAEALMQMRPDPFGTAVTVAEIYQDIVPYRAVRTRLGFEMNADYEHTLLQLLAGVGGLVRLEPKQARDELKSEIETPNPNVGLFRKFAGCDVWIAKPREGVHLEPLPARGSAIALHEDERRSAERAEAPASQPHAEPAWDEGELEMPELLLEEEVVDESDLVDQMLLEMPADPAPGHSEGETPSLPGLSHPAPGHREDETPSPRGFWQSAVNAEPSDRVDRAGEWGSYDDVSSAPANRIEPEPEPAPAPSSARRPAVVVPSREPSNGRLAMDKTSDVCVFCDSNLPAGRAARFCPFCGIDQSLRPCPACAEPLASDWRYCIACGTQSSA